MSLSETKKRWGETMSIAKEARAVIADAGTDEQKKKDQIRLAIYLARAQLRNIQRLSGITDEELEGLSGEEGTEDSDSRATS